MPQVAVAKDGTIYVADGYCNHRVLCYSASGVFQAEITTPTLMPPLHIPHSLVLDECHRVLYVADREAARVHRFDLSSRHHLGAGP